MVPSRGLLALLLHLAGSDQVITQASEAAVSGQAQGSGLDFPSLSKLVGFRVCMRLNALDVGLWNLRWRWLQSPATAVAILRKTLNKPGSCEWQVVGSGSACTSLAVLVSADHGRPCCNEALEPLHRDQTCESFLESIRAFMLDVCKRAFWTAQAKRKTTYTVWSLSENVFRMLGQASPLGFISDEESYGSSWCSLGLAKGLPASSSRGGSVGYFRSEEVFDKSLPRVREQSAVWPVKGRAS